MASASAAGRYSGGHGPSAARTSAREGWVAGIDEPLSYHEGRLSASLNLWLRNMCPKSDRCFLTAPVELRQSTETISNDSDVNPKHVMGIDSALLNEASAAGKILGPRYIR